MNKPIAFRLLLFVSFLYTFASCNSTVDISSMATTGELSEVTTTSATCSGSVVSSGNATVFDSGICWATNPEPTISSSTVPSNNNSGSFTCTITDLMPDMTYYVRAYATTTDNTEYGKVLQLTTPTETGNQPAFLNADLTYSKVTDIEGNEYHTVDIGNQTWIVENLRVTKFRNGNAIPTVTNNGKWNKLKTAAQCTYNNNTEINSIRKFGRLYNYKTVQDTRNIAPTGYHVATADDWNKLETYISDNKGVAKTAAQALASKTDWAESQVIGAVGALDFDTYMSVNNTSGFAALSSGIRADYGVFTSVGTYCAWWVAGTANGTDAGFRSLNNYGIVVGKNTYNQAFGLSVRCVKD